VKKAPDDQLGALEKFGCERRSEGNKKEKVFEQQPTVRARGACVHNLQMNFVECGEEPATVKSQGDSLWLSS